MEKHGLLPEEYGFSLNKPYLFAKKHGFFSKKHRVSGKVSLLSINTY